ETATRNPFSESIQPAEPSTFGQTDKLWVNNLPDRRIPAQTQIGGVPRPDIEASCRNHHEPHCAVVNLDNIDAFLAASGQRPLYDAPRGLGRTIARVKRRKLPLRQ